MPNPSDAKTYARPRAEAAGVHWPTYEKQIQLESGWQHWSAPGVVKSSPTGSMGLGQLNSRFYPESDWRDPYDNLLKSIDIMRGYLQRFGSYRKALAAYNWGPGHVGGGVFGGATHSPWDGTRDWRCSAGHGVSEQCKHYLDTILGNGWPEPTAEPAPTPEVPAMADPWTRTLLTNGSAVSTPSQWPTSNPRPIRSLVWHDMEGYLAGAIATWNQGAASAHLCVLRSGEIVRTVEIENIAWHAGTNATTGRTAFWKANNINPYSIGVELEGFVATGYTREQIDACVNIGRWAQAKYGIRPVRGGDSLDGHHLHGEISNQRSDPGPLFPFDAILSAIKEAPVVTPDTYSVGQGIRDAMAANGDAPATDEMFTKRGDKDEWSEAYGVSGSRYVYLPSTGRTFRYSPAA
jgi:N-acetyl-anhydromuramyl-L-alanine amidase AmpD